MVEVLKTIGPAEQKSDRKTPEATAASGVICEQKNHEVHGQANAVAQANERTLSEPDMIAMDDHEIPEAYKARVAQIQANRFVFFDSEKNNAGDGKTKIHEHPAKQALKPLPGLSPTLQKPPHDSPVKANVQITNVPEVFESVQKEVLGGNEPINPETIEQMGLEGLREAELKALGIEKRVEKALETETRETVEALELAQQKLIKESVEEKLTRYLLDPDHPKQKAKWFESVLGFTLDNKEQLARQIKLDPKNLRPSQSGDWGIMYEQVTKIVGANGRELENCKIYWLQDSETGLFEFKNLLLQKKK